MMQKTMRYHIADGENQPVVRAVALVVQREPADGKSASDRNDSLPTNDSRRTAKARRFRPTLRRVNRSTS